MPYNKRDDKENNAEASLIAKFEKAKMIPSALEEWYDRFEEDRAYVNEDCMLIDEEDTVATNYILRNQYVVGNAINYREPSVGAQPIEQMYGRGPDGKSLGTPPEVIDFANTLRIMDQHNIKLMNTKRVMNGAAQDARTVGISYLKLRVQEDPMRDPIGLKREDDQLNNVKRLQMLQTDFDNKVFDDTSAEYQEMQDLTDLVRAFLIGQIHEDAKQNPLPSVPKMDETGQPMLDEFGMIQYEPDMTDPRHQQLEKIGTEGSLDPTLLPEVPHYRGFMLEQIIPEDVRIEFDNITRPEDFYDSETLQLRVYMSKDEIKSTFKVDDDYFTSLSGGDKSGKRSKRGSQTTEDPGRRTDKEATMMNGRYAIWEAWHRPTNHVYVWMEGCKKFLTKYIPGIVWRKFFPVFPVYFNRVTGRFLPISDTRLVMQLQDEVNTVRTHEREARKSAYPRFIVKKGLFLKGEKLKLERASPYSITETARADQLKEAIHEIAPIRFTPQLYDINKPVREMELMMGVPQAAAGAVGGAKFATETAIADKQMGVQNETQKTQIDDVYNDILTALSEMSLVLYSEADAKMIAGPGAFWPVLGREKLFYQLKVEVIPGSAGRPDVQKKIDLLQNISAIVGNLVAVPGMNIPYVLEMLLQNAEIYDIDPKQLFVPMPPQAQQPAPPASGGTPAPRPMGAPPMSEPRPPGNLPNSMPTQLAS